MKNKRRIILVILSIFLVAFTIWLIWSNLTLEKSYFVVRAEKLPDSFDGFKIVQISDLHNAEFGRDNDNLLSIILAEEPDMIAITGDSIDSRNTNMDITLSFVKRAMEIAQCYFVVGNHESRIEENAYKAFEDSLAALGVIILHNETVFIERNGEQIAIVGVDDIMYDSNFNDNIKNCALPNEYSILLSHRPEHFEEYVENGYTLVLSGHAHGGQFRLPFLGGLYTPGQGLFPEYDAGIYSKNGTDMIVSRGVGNSIFPVRFNNRPEIVIIELKGDSN